MCPVIQGEHLLYKFC